MLQYKIEQWHEPVQYTIVWTVLVWDTQTATKTYSSIDSFVI